MYLILDDIRDAKMCFEATNDTIYLNREWTIVRSYGEFCNFIMYNEMPNIISFDHDLGDFLEIDGSKVERTGKDCLQFLIDHIMDNNLKIPNILIHSSNVPGRISIKSLYDNFIKFQKKI